MLISEKGAFNKENEKNTNPLFCSPYIHWKVPTRALIRPWVPNCDQLELTWGQWFARQALREREQFGTHGRRRPGVGSCTKSSTLKRWKVTNVQKINFNWKNSFFWFNGCDFPECIMVRWQIKQNLFWNWDYAYKKINWNVVYKFKIRKIVHQI